VIGGELVAAGRRQSRAEPEPESVVDIENGCGSCGSTRPPLEMFGLEVLRAGRTGQGRGPRVGRIRLCRRCLRSASVAA
jgi:ribosomal protein S14